MRIVCLAATLWMASCSVPVETKKDNLLIASRLFDSFNKHDWKTMASLYSDSAKFLDPSFGKQYVNQSGEQIIAKYSELQKLFPDINDRVVGMYVSGDRVTVEFVSTGTMQGGFNLELPIVTILTIKSGRIISDATYYDLENP